MVERGTRAPVPHVDVLFKGAGEQAVTSGADGTFRLALQPGRYDVRVLGADVYGPPRALVVGGGSPAQRVEIEVDRLATVAGRVLDHLGAPVAGATVTARVPEDLPRREVREDMIGREGTSKPDGAFEVAVLAGDVHLIADLAGIQGYAQVRGLPPGGSRAGVEIRLRSTTRMEGLVRAPDGRAMAGASVRAAIRVRGTAIRQGVEATTGSGGEFVLEGIMQGVAFLEARHPDFGPSRLRREHLRSDGRTRVELVLTERQSLAGRVVDGAGRPVPEAKVRAEPVGSRWRPEAFLTDTEGRFRIDGLGRGPHQLTVEKEGMATWRREDVAAPNQALEIVLTP